MFGFKTWKFWEVGGTCMKFPPWQGYGFFLELHSVKNDNKVDSYL